MPTVASLGDDGAGGEMGGVETQLRPLEMGLLQFSPSNELLSLLGQ